MMDSKKETEGSPVKQQCCPYCKNKMEPGYFDQACGLSAWVPEGETLPVLFPARTGRCISFGDPDDGPLLGSRVTAYLCRDCGKLIVDVHD